MKTCNFCGNEAVHFGDTAPCQRDIVSYPGYRVSCAGRVWSCWDSSGKQTDEWRALKGRKTKRQPPYMQVNLYRDRVPLNRYVHLLVLEAYVGPCPPGNQGCHGDCNSLNNAIGNLRWGTILENRADTVALGRLARGERFPQAKLTDAKVKDARTRYASGTSAELLAAEYGIHIRNMYQALNGTTWKHVT